MGTALPQEIVFGDPLRSTFASYGAGYLDGEALPFGLLPALRNLYQNLPGEPLQYQTNFSKRANSYFATPIQDLPIPEVMYGESSGPNKRPHVEETSAPTTGRTQGCQRKTGKKGKRK